MAFIPTIASAQKNINSARTILQDAEAQVAEGRAQLQAEVDAGRLTPGTQEFLNARNQLVNSRQSFAETAKIKRECFVTPDSPRIGSVPRLPLA